MSFSKVVLLLSVLCLAIASLVHAETGAQGWLRYAALPPQAAQQYRMLPLQIVAVTHSSIASNAATELARGLHSMLREDFQLVRSSASEDAFVIGTPAEIARLFP